MSDRRELFVVDDDPDWSDLARAWLTGAGYAVRAAATGKAALRALFARVPDGVLVDFNMPDITGIELCRRLRSRAETRTVPILVLSGPSRERIATLKAGADYFLPKSDDPGELLAVLEALFRRVDMAAGVLTLEDLRLSPAGHKVFLAGRPAAELTPKKFDLLYRLVLRSPEPVGRDELAAVLGTPEGASRSRATDILLNRLRKSLPPAIARRIRSVQGFGYLYLPANR